MLECVKEPRNVQDQYAVAVKKTGTIIRHLPLRLSRVCLFLLRGARYPVQQLGEKILHRSVHRIELTFYVLCTMHTGYFLWTPSRSSSSLLNSLGSKFSF